MNRIARSLDFISMVPTAIATSNGTVVEGAFTAVATEKSDLGQLSFDRDPAGWVVRTVSGMLSYDVPTPGDTDQSDATDRSGSNRTTTAVDVRVRAYALVPKQAGGSRPATECCL